MSTMSYQISLKTIIKTLPVTEYEVPFPFCIIKQQQYGLLSSLTMTRLTIRPVLAGTVPLFKPCPGVPLG